MVKRQLTLGFLLLFLFLIFNTCVLSNPLPVYNHAGSPTVNVDTPIQFVSEKVEYTIGDRLQVNVTAEYTFFNPSDEMINITIWLPFEIRRESVINLTIDNQKNYSYFRNQPIEGINGFFDYARFTQSIESNTNITIIVAYELNRAVSSNNYLFHKGYSIKYLSETGKLWNKPIEKAEFIFKIHKNYCNSVFEGFNIHYDGEYIVASKSYSNWIPQHNIQIFWFKGNVLLTHIAYFTPLFLIILFIVLVILIKRKKQKKFN